MNESLEKEEIEMEVTDEYGEIIYSGTYEEFLAQNEYDIELEDVLNWVQSESARQWENEDGEVLIIRKVA